MLDGALQWNNSIEFEKFLNDFFIKYYFPTYDSEFDAGMNDCSLTTFLCELLRHDSECVNNNPLFSNNNCTYFVDINIINNLNIMFEYFWSNPLHADLFPQIRQMEVDIVKMLMYP